MSLLDRPTPFLFFTGKGGVGKTSLSCSMAVLLADSGKRVLLVSTDPASNLEQVLGVKIGGKPTPVATVKNLSAVNIDPERAASEYRNRIIDPYRGELPDTMIAQMEEQLSGACTVEIAAFDEFTGFLADKSVTDAFDHVIFDTAPTGHTLRLLKLPAAWTGFLETNMRGASCLGPASGLKQQQGRYASTRSALSDPNQTTLVLVSRPDLIALHEAARSADDLREQGLINQHLILNGVFSTSVKNDAIAQAFQRRSLDAINHIPDSLKVLPTTKTVLQGHNIVGIDALRGLFASSGYRHRHGAVEAFDEVMSTDGLIEFQALVDDLCAPEQGLIMVMGKGGVGKTTIAAAVAYELAQRGYPVHLSTTDPAAHLQLVVGAGIKGLEVSRIDPKKAVEIYVQHTLETQGKNLDADGLALLKEDLRSPCTEEVAVFREFSSIVSKARSGFVVLDTAPTGHTLLLLDTAGAYHREVERSAAKSDVSHTTPLMRLQNADYTKILITTLAENTPVAEAVKLQDDLGRAGIKPYAWVVNQSLAATETCDPILRQRSQSEIELIEQIQTKHAGKTVVIPWLAESPTGPDGLEQIARQQWQSMDAKTDLTHTVSPEG